MELNTPTPSSQYPDSELSHQAPPAQPLAAPPVISSQDIFRHIQSYPFVSDQDYQLGLAVILGHPDTPATESELASSPDLVHQTQCFYIARKYDLPQVDVAEYKAWLDSNVETSSSAAPQQVEAVVGTHPAEIERPSAPTPSTAAAASTLSVQPNHQSASPSNTAPAAEGPAPPYPTSFADIVDLITQNKPIPGIETIPDTVLEPGSSKQDKTTRRKKPWEKDDTATPQTAQENIDVDQRIRTGEGVMKILQPNAVPDSGLISKE